jgi:general secretion pathway protein B
MSLILEALRKSEAERRRGEMPDLRAELPPAPAPRRGSLRALPWIAAAVAIGLALAWWLRPWPRDTAPISVPSTATTTPVAAPAESLRLQPRVAVAPPAVATRLPAREPAQPARSDATPPAPVAPEPAPAAPREESPPPASIASGAAETPVNALSADLREALPPLQLSMHMWDPDPAKRFVILDGERHVEGDSVGPMRIRRIDAQGVLFDWQGRAVRLPLR